MMTVFIFVGPTLSPEEGRAELDAIYLPPVAQGDLYRAALRRPEAIGIIDGYFERVPAVWHKEILWAMGKGIHVFGSASMGALRAAELEVFGMEGVGKIFEAFRDGVLEDDDEVAVAHGPADTGYREQSDAMVNIRATLAAAEAAQILGRETRLQVEEIAKGLFYPERIYPLILERAMRSAAVVSDLKAFQVWLPAGRVNQKREDALAMLRRMREHLRADSGPKRVPWRFEHTDTWDEVTCQAGELELASSPVAETLLLDRLLDELRLAGDPYRRARQGATARLLAIGEARRQGVAVTREKLQETTDSFRRERRLLEPEDVARWLTENHLTLEEFARLMEDEAKWRWVEEMTKAEAAMLVPDYLRAEGEYPRWRGQALVKQRALEAGGAQNPALADVGLTEPMLLRWYFEERLGRPVPDDVAYYAHSLGFPSEDAFRLALLCEYSYSVDSQLPPAPS
jgi:hypothetical protein